MSVPPDDPRVPPESGVEDETIVDETRVVRPGAPGEPEVNYQEVLMRDAVTRSKAATRPWELTV